MTAMYPHVDSPDCECHTDVKTISLFTGPIHRHPFNFFKMKNASLFVDQRNRTEHPFLLRGKFLMCRLFKQPEAL